MNDHLQKQLFDKIQSNFSRKADMVNQLSEQLSLGRDAIYRRLRGDTLLTPTEISQLARAFNISLDGLVFENTDAVFFTFNAFSNQIKKVEDYLHNLKGLVNQVLAIPETRVYYASFAIPIFYYCLFPELISFKLYVWGRTIWNLPYMLEKKFHFDVVEPETQELATEVLEAYIKLDTAEFWSMNVIDHALFQIEYHLNSGLFKDPMDANRLCEVLDELVEHMWSMAQYGRKFAIGDDPESGNPFEMYHNEIIFTNNTILLSSPHARLVFSSFGNPNYIRSADPRLCDYVDKWFKQIISRSSSISSHSEKNRNLYFNNLKRRISITKKKVEMHLEEGLSNQY